MAKQIPAEIEKDHQIRRYDGSEFGFGGIKVPKGACEIFFEYFLGHGIGNLYLRDLAGQTIGEVIKLSVGELLQFEERYKEHLAGMVAKARAG